MYTLKIEHPVTDFETWRAAFDRDPVGRQRSGVRAYRVFRPVDDSRYVIIDLDFETTAQAQSFLDALHELWDRVDLSPGLLRAAAEPRVKPQSRIVDQVASVRY